MIGIALSPAPQRRSFTSSLPLTIGRRRWRSFDDALPTSCNRRRHAKNHPGLDRARSRRPASPSKPAAFTCPTHSCQTVERFNPHRALA
jgi:hypothetical protein